MRRGRVFWGALLLLAGAWLLLNNLGLLPVNFSQVLWPIIIIFVGLWILLQRRVLPAALEPEELTLPRQGVARAEYTFRHGVGRLRIEAGASTEELLRGTFLGGVNERQQVTGDRALVDLSVPPDSWMGFPWGSGRGFEWAVQLPSDLPMELTVEAGAGELSMNLEQLPVSRLRLKTGASSSEVRLPAVVDDCRVKLDAGVASVKLWVPDDAGATVTASMGLAEIKVDPGRFQKTASGYETMGFESASRKIEIAIDAGVSSVEIR